jgi:hypothetical protein
VKLTGRRHQLVGLRLRWRAIRTACSWLRPSGDAGHLGPNLEGRRPGGSILDGWNLVAAEQDEVVHPVMGGQEALCLARRPEARHLPLRSRRGLVRFLVLVFRALCFLCSPDGMTSRLAAPQLASLSVTITRGAWLCRSSSLHSRRLAACVLRRL